MRSLIKEAVRKFRDSSKDSRIKIVSHFDTDGITSAALMCKALNRAGIKFSLEVVKDLSEAFVKGLPKDSVVVFLDLGGGSLGLFEHLKEVFVIDHHQVKTNNLGNTFLINPHLVGDREELCSAGVSYLFAKELLGVGNCEDLADLAVIGTVGDLVVQRGKLNIEIQKDAGVSPKKGLLLYPATRPLDKALEYSSSLFIPGVTGNLKGVRDLLAEARIDKEGNQFKSLVELSEDEVSRLTTAIIIRRKDYDNSEIIGDIYLVKFSGSLEDARELSARINSCSRAGFSHIALGFCLNNRHFRKESEKIHAKYKQEIINALNYINSSEANKLEGSKYVIFNAKDKVKDTMIGTVSSMMAFSKNYENGTFIIGMGYSKDKVKVSMRIVGGAKSRKANDLLGSVMDSLEGEWGGHASSAGCTISKDDEDKFVDLMKKKLEVEVVHM